MACALNAQNSDSNCTNQQKYVKNKMQMTKYSFMEQNITKSKFALTG